MLNRYIAKTTQFSIMDRMKTVIVSFLLASSAWAAVPKDSKTETFPEGERMIYSRLQASFQKGDEEDVVKQKKLLEKNYPASVHLANAAFLLGALEYSQNHLGEALRAFDQVVNQYPLSNKRPSALFAMGMTYKKLELPNQATAVLDRVIQSYPGSPEAQRATLEVKLIAKAKADAKDEEKKTKKD
jgi:tol-pal system protein YbgF